MKKSEIKTRFQEMHFQGGMRLDQVLRALQSGSDREIISSLYELDNDRIGQPTSVGGEYSEGYFACLDDHISSLKELAGEG